jgi:hypothetical protein
MKLKIQSIIIILFLTNTSLCLSQTNYLKIATEKLSSKSENIFLNFNYVEQENVLGHNFQPWETNTYSIKGKLWFKKSQFLKRDSLKTHRNRTYTSKTDIKDFDMLHLDYGDQEIMTMSSNMFFEKLMNTARYTPLTLLQYVIQNNKNMVLKTTPEHAIYSTKINKYQTEIHIGLNTNLVEKIIYIGYDELYGDVKTTFNYSEYSSKEQVSFPKNITIKKINGKVIDQVEITNSALTSNLPELLIKPADFQIIEDEIQIYERLKTTKYNDFIYFIDLIHTDDKVMVVEFEDYVLVAEAPINSKNGELIISEVKKLIPYKPIKYFVFGHHHPHYLGGLRAFVHKEATILCTPMSKEYVEFIAKNSHLLQPDSLELKPKPLKTQIIKDRLLLGKNRKMEIYCIGEKSKHTIDYLIYYFPEERLLFQDDLCWIPKNGEIKKASPRQLGLYNSIKDLNLNVETIIQSWPIESHKVKTVIPFSDLERSVLQN